jgi:hypothetical protein
MTTDVGAPAETPFTVVDVLENIVAFAGVWADPGPFVQCRSVSRNWYLAVRGAYVLHHRCTHSKETWVPSDGKDMGRCQIVALRDDAVSLSYTGIMRWPPFDFSKLEELHLSCMGNQVCDISGMVERVRSVTLTVDLKGTRITELPALVGRTNIRSLEIIHNLPWDVFCLPYLENLEGLRLAIDPYGSISWDFGGAGLPTSLTDLDIEGAAEDRVDLPLGLRRLRIRYREPSAPANIERFPRTLIHLDFAPKTITAAFEELVFLETLVLDMTHFQVAPDFNHLAGCVKLRHLMLCAGSGNVTHIHIPPAITSRLATLELRGVMAFNADGEEILAFGEDGADANRTFSADWFGHKRPQTLDLGELGVTCITIAPCQWSV